jgi:hypothetical protein
LRGGAVNRDVLSGPIFPPEIWVGRQWEVAHIICW